VNTPVKSGLEPGIQLELGLDDELPELHSYAVRVSARARNVSLRVIPVTGLEVTIPRRFPRRDIPDIIASNRRWIEKQLARVRRETDPEFLHWPPRILRLSALDTVVLVHCLPSSVATVTARWNGDSLLLSGNIGERGSLLAGLAAGLRLKARQTLLPELHALAAQHGLSVQRTAIRGQRTLWGSYSSSGTLSLNYKLLFLPKDLVRYVLLHELAHTRYLDHSPRFWRFLCSLEPQARSLDRQLGEAGKRVPPWLESA